MVGHCFRQILFYCAISALIFIAVTAGAVWHFREGLPSFEKLEKVDLAETTIIYSSDGVVLRKYWVQRRDPISYSQLPKFAVDALISAEDQRFWSHWGVSLPDIFRAVVRNILREGSLKGHGASTITQQLARNLFLTRDQTWGRKFQEQLTAVLLERTYTKKEILEMYFNQMLFGRGAWGIQAAAHGFFGKDAVELTLDECALLVGLLKGPYYYSPIGYPKRAIERRDWVLKRMYLEGKISTSDLRSASLRPIMLRQQEQESGEAPYFTEYIRQHMEATHGFEVLYGGASVFTSLDSRVQRIAEEELQRQLEEIQRKVDRDRLRNPPDSAFWEGVETREDTLAATVVQGAFVALDPSTGLILAMVGGRDFNESKFNRALQALRQPGSSFKPFIYTAAIDKGYPPTMRLPDTAVTIKMGDGSLWRPENYDRKFLGWMTMREGLAMSRNVVTTRLLEQIGPRVARTYAQRMGISTPIRPVLSLGMGTSEVKLIDLTSAFGVFANRGIRVSPVAVLKVANKGGSVLEERTQGTKEVVLKEATAAVMASLLRSVMDLSSGTAYSARTQYGFRRPAAGKTGTTQNFVDAWFVGFTPRIVAGVWVGFDSKVSLGNRMAGSVVAMPIWARFMKRVHNLLNLPEEDFELPDTVVQVEVCGDTHKVASIYCPTRFEEVFIPGAAPKHPCPDHLAVRMDQDDRQERKETKRTYQF